MYKLIIVLTFSLLGRVVLAGQPIVELSSVDSVQNITQNITYLLDKEGELELKDVLQLPDTDFTRPSSKMLNFGTKKVYFWLKVVVDKPVADYHQWFLELRTPFLNEAIFYFQEGTEEWQSVKQGRTLPFSERLVGHPTFFYEIPKEAKGRRVYYVRGTGYYLKFPVKIGAARAFWETYHILDFLYGLFYGFIILVATYNFFVYLSIKEKSFLYYVLFAVANGLLQVHLNGHGTEYLWGEIAWFGLHPSWSPALTGIFMSVFTISFLELRERVPVFANIFQGVIGVYVFALFIDIVQVHSVLSSLITQMTLLVNVLLMLAVSIVLMSRGYKPARYFMLAWIFYLIAGVIYIISSLNVIEYHSSYSISILVGSALEMVLLSLALADRIKYYRKRNEEAQQEALDVAYETEIFMKHEYDMLEQKVKQRTEELQDKNERLNAAVSIVSEKNKLVKSKREKVTSSIQYAQRIQSAVFPTPSKVSSILPDSMIYFSPKDIVSGDFYWFEQVGHKKIVAAVDCTGHGVPGAFMSLIGSNLLDDAVMKDGITDPGEILAYMNRKVISILKQKTTNNKDGMDAAVCVIDEEQKQIVFSGAKNPLILIQDGEVKELKGDKKAVGGMKRTDRLGEDYITHSVELKENTVGYLFSDGYMDQFGGEQNRKFMKRPFVNLLKEIHKLPMEEQRTVLAERFKEWKGGKAQIDDVLVIGFRY